MVNHTCPCPQRAGAVTLLVTACVTQVALSREARLQSLGSQTRAL